MRVPGYRVGFIADEYNFGCLTDGMVSDWLGRVG